jgi:hypothetical protein
MAWPAWRRRSYQCHACAGRYTGAAGNTLCPNRGIPSCKAQVSSTDYVYSGNTDGTIHEEGGC